MTRIKLSKLITETVQISSYKVLYDLIDNHTSSVKFAAGSETRTKPNWSRNDIDYQLRRSFKMLFMDRNFSANYLDRDEEKEYEKAIQEFIEKKLMKDVKWFNLYHDVDIDRHGRLTIEWSTSHQKTEELKTIFFKMNKRKLSKELKNSYISYINQYTGKDIKL